MTEEIEYKNLSVRPDTHKKIRLLCAEHGKSNDQVISEMLDIYRAFLNNSDRVINQISEPTP